MAADLKRAKRAGTEVRQLTGKSIALILKKHLLVQEALLRVAAYDQGAHTTFFDPSVSRIGHKESIKDSARVLGSMYDAIEYRGFSQEVVEELAEYSGVPVFNGLTDGNGIRHRCCLRSVDNERNLPETMEKD